MADFREVEITKLSTRSTSIREPGSVEESQISTELQVGTATTTPNGAHRRTGQPAAEAVYIDLLLLGKTVMIFIIRIP